MASLFGAILATILNYFLVSAAVKNIFMVTTILVIFMYFLVKKAFRDDEDEFEEYILT